MTTSLSWLRKIAQERPELNTIPLFGNAPPFDWAAFSSSISTNFGLSNLKIRPKDQVWKEGGAIKKGLGAEAHSLSINIAPLGPIYWMISEEDLGKLTLALMKPAHKTPAPLSEMFQEGFYRFFSLQALDLLSNTPPFTDLTLQISTEEENVEKAFCIDIEIDLGEKSCWGRLVIPQEFRSKWIQHFSHLPNEYFPREVANQTFLDLFLKVGSVILHQDEWKQIRPGDFVQLDEGYDPHKGSGTCLLMLGSTPLFSAKIKQGKVEITDYALYYEDSMSSEPPKNTPFQEEEPPQEERVALKEIPLYVTVEIARLKMTLDKLMHLTPGNTLELPVHPDQGVSLTINGQQVAKAELVYLGEQLGIRILEI